MGSQGLKVYYVRRADTWLHIQCASFRIIHLHLRLLAQILNLGLAKYDVGVGGGVLVNVGLVDDEEDVLGLPNGHPGNAGHLLQAQLAHDLPGFFLT